MLIAGIVVNDWWESNKLNCTYLFSRFLLKYLGADHIQILMLQSICKYVPTAIYGQITRMLMLSRIKTLLKSLLPSLLKYLGEKQWRMKKKLKWYII